MIQAATINIDGGSRGNPGPAAFGYVISGMDGGPIEGKGTLGKQTNNVAEYTALVRALEHASKLGARRLLVRSDSELLVRQMNGQYQVKNPDLKILYQEAKGWCARFDSVTFEHVPRSQNARADELCNLALDQEEKKKPPAASRTGPSRADGASADAVDCLRAAAREWAKGDPGSPRPELVWDQLLSILEDQGLFRAPR